MHLCLLQQGPLEKVSVWAGPARNPQMSDGADNGDDAQQLRHQLAEAVDMRMSSTFALTEACTANGRQACTPAIFRI